MVMEIIKVEYQQQSNQKKMYDRLSKLYQNLQKGEKKNETNEIK